MPGESYKMNDGVGATVLCAKCKKPVRPNEVHKCGTPTTYEELGENVESVKTALGVFDAKTSDTYKVH